VHQRYSLNVLHRFALHIYNNVTLNDVAHGDGVESQNTVGTKSLL